MVSVVGRRAPKLGFAAVAMLVALAAPAMACFNYSGKIQLDGLGGSGGGTDVFEAQPSFMTKCDRTTGLQANADNDLKVTLFDDADTASPCNYATTVPDGTYNVYVRKSNTDADACANPGDPLQGTLVGTLAMTTTPVNTHTTGASWQGTISGANGTYTVCVENSGAGGPGVGYFGVAGQFNRI